MLPSLQNKGGVKIKVFKCPYIFIFGGHRTLGIYSRRGGECCVRLLGEFPRLCLLMT